MRTGTCNSPSEKIRKKYLSVQKNDYLIWKIFLYSKIVSNNAVTIVSKIVNTRDRYKCVSPQSAAVHCYATSAGERMKPCHIQRLVSLHISFAVMPVL